MAAAERVAPVREEDRRRAVAAARKRVLIALAVLAPLAFLAWRAFHSGSAVKKLSPTAVGIPEPYARPVVADVDGDGVEDVILVTTMDRGRQSSEEHGRFAFVQAIDGKDGRVLYSIDQGRANSSGGDAKSSPRIVLVASKDRLGVARIPATGRTSLTIHELATGKELKELSFEPSTGRACENRGGPSSPKGTFFFERPGGSSGTVVDLDRATATAPARSTCGEVATANVADAPAESSTERTEGAPRFSQETRLRKGAGPYGGKTLVVLSSGLGFLVVDDKGAEPGATSASDGGVRPGDSGHGATEVVGLDVAAGKTLFERSLASLGFTTQEVDHIEATDRGPLLFFEGSAGLALLDATRGDKTWALGLPKGLHISSYTLTKGRAYLHVSGADSTTDDSVSKERSSRVLIVDLANGTYVRSLPEGPLDPEPPPAGGAGSPEPSPRP